MTKPVNNTCFHPYIIIHCVLNDQKKINNLQCYLFVKAFAFRCHTGFTDMITTTPLLVENWQTIHIRASQIANPPLPCTSPAVVGVCVV